MTIQLKCPSCRKPIFFPEVEEIDEDQLEIICPGCQYKYSLVSAQVLGFASEVETTPANKYKKQPSYRHIYELRLLTANRKLKALRLETPGPEQKISAFPKDEMLMLYTLRGKALDELVWIENHTTGKSCLLKKPDAKARSAGVTTGIVTLFAGGVLAMLVHLPGKLSLAIVVPASVGAGVYVTQLNESKSRDKKEITRLASEQSLLGQIHSLDHRIHELKRELASNQKTINRFKALRQKMIDAGEDIYAYRVETISKGISVMEKQRGLTQNLIDGYAQVVAILEIEFQTSRLAEALPEDVSEQILGRMQELKAIEDKREELALLVDSARILREH
ncbi:hypothetical protein AVDCRST_MAG81-1004 [uncultured Synechococcales cyanobacterium]|uniref:Uncharacterized protein n=1 Tax=uncultured Synechococcales cyanobacterium TaxID=1936017 RepID=A0A6J4V5Q3_9CYAN|nr:hypothetical protein AVDCRST_MAG81-1004 [uncultured Synechococcales cyanobacterium]